MELTRQPQAAVIQVAKELGVNANGLCRWRQELATPDKASTATP